MLLVGIVLLNPRIMEYDVAPITVPLALVAWRYVRTQQQRTRWITVMLALFVILNVGAIYNWELRKALDGPLLVAILFAGLWFLLRTVRAGRGASNEAESRYADSVHRTAEHAVTFATPTPFHRSA